MERNPTLFSHNVSWTLISGGEKKEETWPGGMQSLSWWDYWRLKRTGVSGLGVVNCQLVKLWQEQTGTNGQTESSKTLPQVELYTSPHILWSSLSSCSPDLDTWQASWLSLYLQHCLEKPGGDSAKTTDLWTQKSHSLYKQINIKGCTVGVCGGGNSRQAVVIHFTWNRVGLWGRIHRLQGRWLIN